MNSSSDGGIVLQDTDSASHERSGAFFPATWNQQTIAVISKTTTPIPQPCGVVALTAGGVDHLYFNGQELSYSTQGNSLGVVTISAGTGYVFGSPGITNGAYLQNGWQGTIDYAVFYSGALTAAQIAQVSAYVNYQVSNRPGL